MTEWATQWMERYGYAGVALLMLLENVFPPIPSEVVLPLAGYTASQGELSMPMVVLAAVVGSMLGALLFYWFGQRLGRERARRFVEKHGAWLTMDTDDLDRAERWFERHGGKAVLLCRFVPGLRSLISVPAGMVSMPMGPFLGLSTLGTLVWCAALAWAGSALGQRYDQVAVVLDPVLYVILAGVAVVYVVRLVRMRRASA
jgi:membrane protein DedA with SNARE-associated domain